MSGKYLLNVIMCLVLVAVTACGKKDGSASNNSLSLDSMAFPETGNTDLLTISAGTYKASAIRSYLMGTARDKRLRAVFQHSFREVGNPQRNDTYDSVTDYAGLNQSDEAVQLRMDITLPLRLEASGTKVEFHALTPYYHYTSSNGGRGWWIRSSEGRDFHAVFAAENRRNNAIYGTELIRGTSQLRGDTLLVTYEVKLMREGQLTSQQIVEITYKKQSGTTAPVPTPVVIDPRLQGRWRGALGVQMQINGTEITVSMADPAYRPATCPVRITATTLTLEQDCSTSNGRISTGLMAGVYTYTVLNNDLSLTDTAARTFSFSR